MTLMKSAEFYPSNFGYMLRRFSHNEESIPIPDTESKPIEIKGKISDKAKNLVKDHLEGRRSGRKKSELMEGVEKVEIDKNEIQRRSIEMANKYLAKKKAELGLRHQDIDESRIHLISDKDADALGIETSFYDGQEGNLFIKLDRDDLPEIWIAQIIFHEMVHASAYESFYVDQSGQTLTPHQHRVGLKTRSRQGDQRFLLTGLDEAVTEDLCHEYFDDVLVRSRMFRNEVKAHSKLAKKLGAEQIDIEPGRQFFLFPRKGRGEYTILKGDYPGPIKVQRLIESEVSRTQPQEYPNPSDVTKLLRRSVFKGHLIDLGRALTEAFGKDGFEMITKMQNTEDSARDTLALLKKKKEFGGLK